MHDLPAILGGTPIRPQGAPDWPPADADVGAALDRALRDGSWGKYDGGQVEKLEQQLAQCHEIPFALTCASGTLAVETALRALQVGPGDEVVVPAYDYEANFLCVHAVGAMPVLVDVSANNACLDPEKLAEAIGPKTKVILVSHLHGGLAPMGDVMDRASKHGLRVIEDAAQVPGAVVQGRRAGTWGDVGVLSFGGSKLLSAGRGGALLTRHADVQQRLRVALRRGVQQWAALSELQAVALLPQLAKLDDRNSRRADSVKQLCDLLVAVPGLRAFANDGGNSQPAFYKLGFWYDVEQFGLSRARLVAAMRAEGVAFDEGFRAVHVGRADGRFRRGGDLHEAERAHHGVVVLHHPVLLASNDDIAQVARAVHKIYANAQRLRQ